MSCTSSNTDDHETIPFRPALNHTNTFPTAQHADAVRPTPRRRTTNSRPPLLRHPTPSTSDIHAAYGSNIMALEQRAEEMSQEGSDIGEEIRRMNEVERSRQNSIQSSHQGDSNGVRGGAGGFLGSMRSRQSSAAGVASSVVDVNGNAPRYGGTGSGMVTSPTGSVRSGGSWSHASASMARKASASGSSRLAQMVEPMQEGRPLDSPLAPSHSSLSRQASQASQNSFARRYDEIAGEIEEQLGNVPPSPPKRVSAVVEDPEYEEEGRGRSPAWQMERSVPLLRPRSTDTYQEAQVAFRDFDGVHFEPETDEYVEIDEHGNEVRRVSARSTSGGTLSQDAVSMLRSARGRPMTYAAPPPAEGMVYYPAPVPRMLNLPKRLSQLPSASVQAQRRSQLLGQLGPGARQSAPWLSQMTLSAAKSSADSHHNESDVNHEAPDHPEPFLNERMSMANFSNLPPQLRASVFFDHQSVQQDVQIKSESASATLNSILAASATAPVSAFTDHPFAGDVRKSVYAPEIASKARRSTTSLGTTVALESESPKKTKKRRSIGDLLRRTSTADLLGDEATKSTSRPGSVMMDFNEGGRKLQKRKSGMSLGSVGDELDRQKGEPVRAPGREIGEPDLNSGLIDQAHNASSAEEDDDETHRSRPSTAMSKLKNKTLSANEEIEEDFKEADAADDEEGEPIFAAPTTLLAELQLRKMNLKSRNRTAATAFPNGMHSTLLELDAVEQIKQKKRRAHRVPLAWEDPAQQPPEEDSDDEVPLGMLFPAKGGLVPGMKRVGDGKDWDRPLGLMEKRELEDNEPLASRRNRLLGLPPDHGRRQNILPSASQLHLAGQPDADEAEAEDEHADETLAQRMRRLRTKNELDGALEGLDTAEAQGKDKSRPVSTFTDDLLGQFGSAAGDDTQAAEGASTSPKAAQDAATTAEPIDEEEETLGQRRARLQREREVFGQSATRPQALRQTSSFGNLLANNPIGQRPNPTSKDRHIPAAGTLLHTSAAQKAKEKAELYQTNTRSSSYGLERPMVNAAQQPFARQPSYSGLLAQQPAGMAPSGGFAGGMYNNGMGGAQIPTSVSTPGMMGYGGMQGSYFPQQQQQVYQPATYHPVGYQPQQQMIMPGYGYPPLGQMGAGYGQFGQMMPPQQQQMMGMPGMWTGTAAAEAKQRDAIDQWRMSVHM